MADDAALPIAERTWRRRALPQIDDAFVRAMLAPWPELVGRPWQVLGDGLQSLNLRIGDVVARIACAGQETLEKEASLLKLIADHVRVPRLLGQSSSVLLLEWTAHVDLPAGVEAGQQVGAVAAAIHRHRFDACGLLSGDLALAVKFSSAYDGLRSWAENKISVDVAARLGTQRERIIRCWDRYADALRALAGDPCLTHADFKPANVKWLPDQREVLVFDWEYAWAGTGLADIGQMLRASPPEAFVDAMADGYRAAGGVLPAGWRKYAAVFDVFNLVGLLSAEADDQRIADVQRWIDAALTIAEVGGEV